MRGNVSVGARRSAYATDAFGTSFESLEPREGLEPPIFPPYKGGAVAADATVAVVERETGIEPATSTLEGSHSAN